ncbi:MAG: Lrp/AsnC ligand binding domain-containing protein [Candidatus Hadarchaeota archaeon]|nr:Lrp/AsnC ligand binding domain-containing protein [Candidatus Hadarchaeota archaeon]
MTGAYILIKTTVGKMREACEKIGGLKNIRSTRMVTGPYDIIAFAEAEEVSVVIGTLMDEVRKVDGVEDTTTCILIE